MRDKVDLVHSLMVRWQEIRTERAEDTEVGRLN